MQNLLIIIQSNILNIHINWIAADTLKMIILVDRKIMDKAARQDKLKNLKWQFYNNRKEEQWKSRNQIIMGIMRWVKWEVKCFKNRR